MLQDRNLGSDPIVAISAPLRNEDGQPVGIIEGSLDLKAFGVIDDVRADLDGADFVLTDQDGRVIYSSPSAALKPLTNISDDPLLTNRAQAGVGPIYSYAAAAPDDGRHFLAVAATTGTGWIVHLRVPLAAIHAQMASDYRAAALFAFITWLIALLLAKSLVRRVSRSIDDMNTVIDGLQLEGDTENIRTPWNTFSELRPIFQHLRQRAVDLKRSYRRLSNSIAAGHKLRSDLNQAIALKEVEVAERTEELQEANERLSNLSKVDTLTGIANRRAFEEFTQRTWDAVERNDRAAAIILVDIDFFKQYNDELGHQAGDDCLRKVALGLKECATRKHDLVARYGGEEFVAMLGETSIDNARIVAARMCEVVARLNIPHPGSPHGNVTISCGVAAAEPATSLSAELTLRQADAALYEAKAAGRNCVAFSNAGDLKLFTDGSVKLDATSVLSIIAAKRR